MTNMQNPIWIHRSNIIAITKNSLKSTQQRTQSQLAGSTPTQKKKKSPITISATKKPRIQILNISTPKKKKKIETNITNKQSKIIVKDEFFSKNKKLCTELLTWLLKRQRKAMYKGMKFGLVGIKRGKRFYFLFCCFVCLGFFVFLGLGTDIQGWD